MRLNYCAAAAAIWRVRL